MNKRETMARRFVIINTILVSLFIVLTVFIKYKSNNVLDLFITLKLQQFHPYWFAIIMRYLTQMGNMAQGVVLVTLAVLLLTVLRHYKDACFVLISSGGITIIGLVIKWLVLRPRPSSQLIYQLGKYTWPDSFPSGHVLFFIGLFGFLFFLTLVHLKKMYLKISILVLLSVLIVGIGVSRIYVGDHWFTDVLGSYVLGLVWLRLMVKLYYHIGYICLNKSNTR